MQLYLSFGYVDEQGESTRLFHLEEPVSADILRDIFNFVRKEIGI